MSDILRDLQHHLTNIFDARGVKAVLAMLAATLFGVQWLQIHSAIVVLFITAWILGLTVAIIQRRVNSSAKAVGYDSYPTKIAGALQSGASCTHAGQT